MKIVPYMLSCPERDQVREQTLASFRDSDCLEEPRIVIERTGLERRQDRQTHAALQLLQAAVAEVTRSEEYILFLEDDLQFNRYLQHNLERWYPLHYLRQDDHFFGSLYNPNIGELKRDSSRSYIIANPDSVYGSQAFILSPVTARHIIANWQDVIGMQDIKMSRLASRVCPLYYHTPSLVQHIGATSVWGGCYHLAMDFDLDWRAKDNTRTEIMERILPDTAVILEHMRQIEGWLDDAEAELLIAIAEQAAKRSPKGQASNFVEVGSYCGRSTVVLGLTLKSLEQEMVRLYAIDPHEGEVSGLDQVVMQLAPTYDTFNRNIMAAGVADVVELIQARSYDVVWDQQIAMLFIDGLHDYNSVARDFYHFSTWIRPGGYVAFHDYAGYFGGVKQFVDELAGQVEYRITAQANSLIVLEKNADRYTPVII